MDILEYLNNCVLVGSSKYPSRTFWFYNTNYSRNNKLNVLLNEIDSFDDITNNLLIFEMNLDTGYFYIRYEPIWEYYDKYKTNKYRIFLENIINEYLRNTPFYQNYQKVIMGEYELSVVRSMKNYNHIEFSTMFNNNNDFYFKYSR
jgi:hypothetical protein